MGVKRIRGGVNAMLQYANSGRKHCDLPFPCPFVPFMLMQEWLGLVFD